MKKAYILALLLLFASFMVGCSNSNEETSKKEPVQNEATSQNEQSNTTTIENLDFPALVFFFTGVGWDYCQSQLVELQNNKELFSQFPGNIYAVSTSSEEEHHQLSKKLQLDYPLVSDPDFEMIKKANLIDPHDDHEPQSLRGFAVIDEAGNITHSQVFDPFGEESAGIIPFAIEKLSAQQ